VLLLAVGKMTAVKMHFTLSEISVFVRQNVLYIDICKRDALMLVG
jgi:hypothetical protein